MLYDKLLKSGINRVFFATILAIMWLAPVVSRVTTSIKSVWEACSHETGHTLGR